MDERERDALIEALKERIPKKQIFTDVPMSRYTTLRLGGLADVLCEIASVEQLSAALTAAASRGVPVTLLGNGSNLLVLDGGLRGLVVHMGDLFGSVSDPVPLPDGRFAITAQSGATLQKLSNAAADNALTGLEFASGIPGTVGGAVYMNAGAYGGEMKDVVEHVTALMPDGSTAAYSCDELGFGYRRSRFCEADTNEAITSVTVCLSRGDGETIRATMREFSARRREKQPIGTPSCGSTFKRPEGRFAGPLIEQAGLKGYRIGGACVSPLHAGFLVNDENGTSADYLALIAYVRAEVLRSSGVTLEPEVRILGEDAPVREV